MRNHLTLLAASVLLASVVVPGLAAGSTSVLVCSEHVGADGEGSTWSAGVQVDSDGPGAQPVVPDPAAVQGEADSLATNLQEEQKFGTSVTHVSVNQDGDEAYGAGTDDLPGYQTPVRDWNGGGDGNWECRKDGNYKDPNGGGTPATPIESLP